jgi:hypothetical protein
LKSAIERCAQKNIALALITFKIHALALKAQVERRARAHFELAAEYDYQLSLKIKHLKKFTLGKGAIG